MHTEAALRLRFSNTNKQRDESMPDANITSAAVLEALRDVRDPEVGRTLSELNMLKRATVESDRIEVEVELPTPAYPQRERIADAVRATLESKVPQQQRIDVRFDWDVRGKD